MATDDFSDILYDSKAKKKNSEATPYAVTGTVLRVRIIAESWDDPEELVALDCGEFEVDSMDYSDSSGGTTASIKATSIPLDASIRHEAHSQGWEDTTLRNIASEIAARGDLELVYELNDDPSLDRVDQRQEGDLAFLERVCKEHGVTVKVSNGKLVLYDEASYEQRPPIVTFRYGDERLLSIDLKQNSSNVASSATATYKDPKSGKLVEETFEPPTAPAVGKKLVVNARPSDLRGDAHRGGGGGRVEISPMAMPMALSATTAASSKNNVADDFSDIRYDARGSAKQKAQSALREQNKKEWTCAISAFGNPSMYAGATFLISGYGVYDGKYIADSVTHALTAGQYTNDIEGHRCLEGY